MTTSLGVSASKGRYAPYLQLLGSVRAGTTILHSNAQRAGLEAGLPEDFVQAEVGEALKVGSQPGTLNYWGNMELSR